MIGLARTLSGDLGDELLGLGPVDAGQVDLEDLALPDVLDGVVAEGVQGVAARSGPGGRGRCL